MPEFPPPGEDRKPLVTPAARRQRSERPPLCRRCGRPSWWNGWRVVFPVVTGPQAATVERGEVALPRAKCSECRRGFTCYPAGHYPQRQYQLDVVAEAVAQVVLGDEPVQHVARTATASTTSVRRWIRWLAGLGRPAEILAVAAQLDPDAPAGAGLAATVGATTPYVRAAQVLAAIEHLGAALVRRGLTLVARSGLGRVLGWQHTTHGEVFALVAGCRSSPAMALGRPPPGQ